MESDFIVDHLTREAIQHCARRDISIPRPLMHFMIRWLVLSREIELRFANQDATTEVHQSIYDQIIDNGPVIRILKLAYYFKNSTTEFAAVQKKYEQITKDKLISLLENICSFNGSGKKDQDEIFKKMIIYIVAANKMFSTKNSEMLSEAKCALRSILTTQDLIDFVTRKKHYRLDYLDRLGKIMCGILLFNKHIGMGGEAIRDVVSDIHVAYQNTMESIRLNMERCSEFITLGLRTTTRTVTVNLVENKIVYRLHEGISIADLELFNKHIYLHLQHERFLHELKEPLGKLKTSIEYNIGQLKEELFKLHDVVKFRLAIPSEMVFPHFTKLFETWYQILMQLYYLVEINQINDEMSAIVSSDYPFEETASKMVTEPVNMLEVALDHLNNEDEEPSVLRIKRRSGALHLNPLQRCCALTMALSNGILTPADTIHGLLPFQEQFMAFKRKEYAEFAEKNYKHFERRFLRTARHNPEICILFNIPTQSADQIQSDNLDPIPKRKTFDAGLQTEHCVPSTSEAARASYSWNLWDYRRRAIQLANLRQRETHSTQTNITYSSREAAVQTYDKTSR